MKKTLKLTALILILACLTAFVGCTSQNTTQNTTPSDAAVEQTPEAPAQTKEPDTETAAPEQTADMNAGDDEQQIQGDPADKDPAVFILGLDESFPPMGYRDQDGSLVGFDLDVAAEVCNRLGWTLELQPIDWGVKEIELEQGNIDCIWNGFTITEERAQVVDFSMPYIENQQVLVVMSDSDIMAQEDVAGRKLGFQAGSSSEDALVLNPDFRAGIGEEVKVNDYALGFMDLEQGSIDALLVDSIVADYYITMLQGDYRVIEGSLAGEQMGIGFRKGSPLRDQVNACLSEMKADGALGEISTKWFGSDVTIVK